MQMLDLRAAKNNMYDDIQKASHKQLKEIHSLLIQLLKKYDNDGTFKNIKDFIGLAMSPQLKSRCRKRFDDLIEEWDKLTPEQKNEFEKDVKDLINKRQSLLELLGNLFRGL